MLTIERLTQKEMCNLARRLKATRIGNNCSIYESIIHDRNKLVKTLQLTNIRCNKYGTYDIDTQQIRYCGGLYGNSGQMHLIMWFDKNDNLHSCYVYYTNLNK